MHQNGAYSQDVHLYGAILISNSIIMSRIGIMPTSMTAVIFSRGFCIFGNLKLCPIKLRSLNDLRALLSLPLELAL